MPMQPGGYPSDNKGYYQQPYPDMPPQNVQQPSYGYPQQPGYGYPQSQQPGYGYPQTQYAYNPDEPVIIAKEPMPQTYSPQPPAPQNLRNLPPVQFGDYPVQVTCPNCSNNISTVIHSHPGALVWILAIILCLIFIPCSCIPFLIPSLYNKNHVCPRCNYTLGSKRVS